MLECAYHERVPILFVAHSHNPPSIRICFSLLSACCTFFRSSGVPTPSTRHATLHVRSRYSDRGCIDPHTRLMDFAMPISSFCFFFPLCTITCVDHRRLLPCLVNDHHHDPRDIWTPSCPVSPLVRPPVDSISCFMHYQISFACFKPRSTRPLLHLLCGGGVPPPSQPTTNTITDLKASTPRHAV
ncbi:hypothetical protein GGS24DRAFT_72362 [Hypoxylon argillaceum]|nr:hypothetical protein GGS24DRAFT_72362 [Hypoxylon argillaceum]